MNPGTILISFLALGGLTAGAVLGMRYITDERENEETPASQAAISCSSPSRLQNRPTPEEAKPGIILGNWPLSEPTRVLITEDKWVDLPAGAVFAPQFAEPGGKYFVFQCGESRLILKGDTLQPDRMIIDPKHPEHEALFNQILRELQP
jgi:hypothetical protein